MRILCISPFFAPAANSEAFCGAKMARALLELGADVTVMSCSDVCSRQQVLDVSKLWDVVSKSCLDVPVPTPPSLRESILMAAQYQTMFYARWVERVVRRAQALHEERKFDIVYSRSLPMCAHVAGYWCARRLGLPWVANINDPWESQYLPGIAFPKVTWLQSFAYKFWLRRTLRSANLVTYPCSRLWQFHLRAGGVNHKAAVVPHVGYAIARKQSNSSRPRLFNLVHAGKLGTTEIPRRPTRPLLIALKQFVAENPAARDVTRLTLVGPEDKNTTSLIRELELQAFVQYAGRVSYEHSLQYIDSAAVCVLVEAEVEEGIFFPSKLADYLVAGKPVLALSPKAGTAADMPPQSGVLRVDANDPQSICAAISTMFSDFQNVNLASRGPAPDFAEQFTSRAVAERFSTLVEAICKPERELPDAPQRGDWNASGEILPTLNAATPNGARPARAESREDLSSITLEMQ